MEKVLIDGTICAKKKSWGDGFEFMFKPYKFDSGSWKETWLSEYTKMAPYQIEIEVPDNIAELVIKNTLTHLQTKRKLVLAENQQKINAIDAKISELLAIENKSEVE